MTRASAAGGSRPIRLLGRNAQTVPTTDRNRERNMIDAANVFSLAEISCPNSFR